MLAGSVSTFLNGSALPSLKANPSGCLLHSHKVFGSMGSRYGVVVHYLREIFTLRVENERVNLVRVNEPRPRVEGGEHVLCDYGLLSVVFFCITNLFFFPISNHT